MFTINNLIITLMVVIPLAMLLRAAYKDTRTSTLLDHTRYTPAPSTVRTFHTPVYDWADPIEQLDFDVLMFECPADPYHQEAN